MISVFPKTAYTTEALAGVGYPILDNWCKSATLYIGLNNVQYIKLVIPHRTAEVKRDLLPKEEDILKIIDMDEEEDYYRIKSIKNTLTETTYIAEHISYDLLNNLIEDTNIVQKDGQGAMFQLQSATQFDHPFEFRSDINRVANIRVVRMNPIQALIGNADNTFLSRLGGELKRQRFRLWMNDRIGVNRTDVIRSRKNLTGFERELDLDGVVTRIMPVGPNGVRLPEKYVDSEYVGNYTQPKIRQIDYQVTYEGDFKELEENEKERVYEELRAAAKKEFQGGIDVPKVSYKVNFVTLQKTEEYKDFKALEYVGIGDTIHVYEESYDIDVLAKVIHIEWDLLNKKYLTIALGNFTNSLVKSSVSFNSKVQSQVRESFETANRAWASADGKKTIYSGPDEPQNPDKDDIWFKQNGENTELWQYLEVDGKLQWVDVTPSSSKVNAAIEAAQQRANEMEVAIQENEAKARELFGTMERTTDLALEAHTLIKSIEDMRKEIETISDTAEIEPDFGQMYNKNRAEFGEAKIPLGTEKITVRHNGKGFEIGQTYTISFKADCIPHPSGGLTLTLNRRMDLPTKVKLIPRTKGLPTIDDTLTVNTKILASVYESVYDFVFENDWAYLESNFTKTAGDQNINRTLAWKSIADGKSHKYTGEWSENAEYILDGGG